MQRHDIPPILVVPLPFVRAVVSFVSHYLSRGFLVVLIIRQFFVGMPGKNRKHERNFQDSRRLFRYGSLSVIEVISLCVR